MSGAQGEILRIRTVLHCQEQWSGGFLVAPVADPELASHGRTLGAALAEQRLFLEDHLASAEPERLARFSFPEGVRLVALEVEAPRHDLPRRLQGLGGPISLSGVVVPFEAESWVFVPALGQTVHVKKGRDPVEVARAECARVAAAQALSPFEWLRLLPPRAESLEEVILHVRRPELAGGERARAARRRRVEASRRDQAREVLASVALPLHERGEVRSGPEVVGREAELASLGALLGGRERQGVVLVGPELCGKSALVHAWLRRERAAGRERQVWVTSASRLIAGMSGLGQWQERVLRVMAAAWELDAVVCFDDLSDLAAQTSSEHVDIPGTLRPFLEEGRVRLLGEITPEALGLLEARHAGFFAHLARLRVEPLGPRATAEALEQRIAWRAGRPDPAPDLAPAAVPRLVALVERYLPYRALPGKAVRLLEELRAAHRQERDAAGAPRPLGEADLYALLSIKTGIPEFLLREDRALHAADVERAFRARLVGQDEAVRAVVETLCTVKAGLQPEGKPLATFLFAGPTGVGKTELARALAAYLFGAADRMFRFDMSEYADPSAAERLIRGTDRAEGLLTRRVRQQPFCVLLLDEIEKAHPAVFDLLLQVCGEGRLSDARGRVAWFRNAILVLTSNLGARVARAPVGLGAAPEADLDRTLREVRQAFRPELLNRLDRIVPFQPLRPDQAEAVARIALDRVRERRGFREGAVELALEEGLLARLAAEGFSGAYGARALRRRLEEALVTPAARALAAAGAAARGGVLRARRGPDGVGVELEKRPAREARGGATAVEEAQVLRRRLDWELAREPVEQLREELATLVAQLANRRDDRREARLVAQQVAEHQRLAPMWREADARRGALQAAEELAMVARFTGEDPAPFLEEARAVFEAHRRALPQLLLATEPKRDAVTLLVQEPDAGEGMALWLAPLLDAAPRRRWRVELRIFGPEPEPGPESGRKARRGRWGPALSADRFRERLQEPGRTFRNALVHVDGPWAILLALEAGLHRHHGVREGIDPVHLVVRTIALERTLPEAQLAGPLLAPPPFQTARELELQPAARRWRDGGVTVPGGVRLDLDRESYWASLELVVAEHLLHLEREGLDRTSLRGAAPAANEARP